MNRPQILALVSVILERQPDFDHTQAIPFAARVLTDGGFSKYRAYPRPEVRSETTDEEVITILALLLETYYTTEHPLGMKPARDVAEGILKNAKEFSW